jgi:hypothetical protein
MNSIVVGAVGLEIAIASAATSGQTAEIMGRRGAM